MILYKGEVKYLLRFSFKCSRFVAKRQRYEHKASTPAWVILEQLFHSFSIKFSKRNKRIDSRSSFPLALAKLLNFQKSLIFKHDLRAF